MSPCIHCQKFRVLAARRLCSTCYKTPEIQCQYPARQMGRPGKHHEPTQAEVDAMVAENYHDMPKGADY